MLDIGIKMDGNNTTLVQEYNRERIRVLLPVDILYSLILLVGVVGNMFVIVIYTLKMKKRPTRIAIFHSNFGIL